MSTRPNGDQGRREPRRIAKATPIDSAQDRDMTDTFTVNHLDAYIEATCFEDEREGFRAFALAQIEDDPTLLDIGWPTLLRHYRLVKG